MLVLTFLILALGLSACNLPRETVTTSSLTTDAETAASTEQPGLIPPTPSSTDLPPTNTPAPIGEFTLAVLVNLDSELVSSAQAQQLVDEASRILYTLTGFVLKMIDYAEMSNPGAMDYLILNAYLNSAPSEIPNGILIFSFGDNNIAKLHGGYSMVFPGPTGFRNSFQSAYAPQGSLYISVLHYSHRFAKCGYGDSDIPISNVSVDGECRNQPGTTCVEKYGYQMCSNDVDSIYASTRTYFASSSLVHEIMHSFGPNGNQDNYWTPECTTAMTSGASSRSYAASTFDSVEAQSYVNMCPFVFDLFMQSYQP